MITAIVIENFKGIGERFRLPIKPITLLFGPNSAGKSTIFHAIHYAREVLGRRNLNADRTTSGGAFVDLGGFQNFVHNRDVRKKVTLRFEMCLKHPTAVTVPLPRFPYWDNGIGNKEVERSIHYFDEPAAAAVEFTVGYHRGAAYVSSYSVDLDGCWIATIEAAHPPSAYGRSIIGGPLKVNFEHPILKTMDPRLKELERSDEEGYPAGDKGKYTGLTRGIGTLSLPDQEDALPDLRNGLCIYFEGVESGEQIHGDGSPLGYAVLDSLLSRLIVGPARLLFDELQGFRYLGPLRETPGRDYSPPQPPDPQRWINGLGAWDALHAAEPAFVEEVSRWLADPVRLDTSYEVKLKRYSELDFDSPLRKGILSYEAASDPEQLASDVVRLPTKKRVLLFKASGEGEVTPRDVGVGISQVLPVAVACLEPGEHFTCIEQPELHLHPRVQCSVGDLIITGALGDLSRTPDRGANTAGDAEDGDEGDNAIVRRPRVLIAETHSEHLILRILRRVRETTRGVDNGDVPPVTPDDISVCYVSQEDGQSVPRTMHIDDEGEFIEPWPDSFFEQDFYERSN